MSARRAPPCAAPSRKARVRGPGGARDQPGGHECRAAAGRPRRHVEVGPMTPRDTGGLPLRRRAPGAAGSVPGYRRRAMTTALWMVAALAALALRLADVQVLHGRSLARQDPADQLRTTVLPAPRGEITDRNGEVLAVSVPADDVTADPTLIPARTDAAHPVDKAVVAARLSPILGAPAASLLQRLEVPGRYAVLHADATPEQAAEVSSLRLPGVFLAPTSVRRYPNPFFMGSVLGFVNAQGGAYGVEASYNSELAGTNGYTLAAEDPSGRPIADAPVQTVPPTPGLNLRLSIDGGLQASLEQEIEAAVATSGASAAYGIVMQPDTGAVLAAAAWPTFDPNAPGEASPAVWANTVQGRDLVPGSVFKTVTAAAALQTGIVTPSTPFLDPGSITVDGVTLHNFTPLERDTTFQRAFDESANVVFAGVGLKLGLPTFYNYLHAFGLNATPGSDLPGEQLNVPRPEAQASLLDLASESFGETLEVTPLSLITAVNVIADGGLLIRPHVGLALVDAGGSVLRRIQPQVVRRVISSQVAAEERQIMVGVVDDGTGQRGFIPCYDAAGKTGTANIYAGGRVSNRYIASFVGFAPADHPAAIALVMLVDPKGTFNEGGEVAAPVVQTVLTDALHTLGVPPQCTAANRLPPGPNAPGTTALVLDMVKMPALQGLTPTSASQATAAVGVRLQVVGSGPRILRQDPPAGAMVQKWTSVQAYTGAGALLPGSFVRVPAVAGQTVAQAAATLSAAGLAMDTAGAGVGVVQDPPAGAEAAPGSSVEVTFSPSGGAPGAT